MKPTNRYTRIIERIFFDHYVEGATEVSFDREDITRVAGEMKIDLPKNLGDIVYTFRYRGQLPESVRAKAPQGPRVDHPPCRARAVLLRGERHHAHRAFGDPG